MSDAAPRNLRAVPVVVATRQPTRFDVHRDNAVEIARLQLAAAIAKEAVDQVARAQAMFEAAAGRNAGARGEAIKSALEGVAIASSRLAEILAEFKGAADA